MCLAESTKQSWNGHQGRRKSQRIGPERCVDSIMWALEAGGPGMTTLAVVERQVDHAGLRGGETSTQDLDAAEARTASTTSAARRPSEKRGRPSGAPPPTAL